MVVFQGLSWGCSQAQGYITELELGAAQKVCWLAIGWLKILDSCHGLSTGIPGYSQDMAAGHPRVSDPREIEGKI